jgi:hypothetical protein
MGDTVGCAICHVQKLEDQFQFQIQHPNIKSDEKKIPLSFLKIFSPVKNYLDRTDGPSICIKKCTI